MAPKEQLAFGLDVLYCEESIGNDEFDVSSVDGESSLIFAPNIINNTQCILPEAEEIAWEDAELESLISKEKETHPGFLEEILDGSLFASRIEAIEWILRVKTCYGFSHLTAVLAINYFDRFVSTATFQNDKPWMSQLTAVACLSLAAKVEETYVPLLLDLQVEESKYVFEAKTIKRMELLVLSSLQWRMHPVTPISFIDHIVRRLGLKSNLHLEFLAKCERLLLLVIADARVLSYPPSVTATVIMMIVIKEIGPWNESEYLNKLLSVMKVNEEEIDGCYKLMKGSLNGVSGGIPMKNPSAPGSPNGVIDAVYSSDSSNDSWSVASSQSSLPYPLFKKRKAQDQQMRLPSLKRMFVDAVSNSR